MWGKRNTGGRGNYSAINEIIVGFIQKTEKKFHMTKLLNLTLKLGKYILP